MRKKLSCVLLIDDSYPGNRYHEYILKDLDVTESVHYVDNGLKALEYFKNESKPRPELVFLDICMPLMDGWEFIAAYGELDQQLKAKTIVMLSTSDNSQDIQRAKQIPDLADYRVKYLTDEVITEIIEKHFPQEN